MKKKKNRWGIAAMLTGATAITTGTGAFLSNKAKTKVKKSIDSSQDGVIRESKKRTNLITEILKLQSGLDDTEEEADEILKKLPTSELKKKRNILEKLKKEKAEEKQLKKQKENWKTKLKTKYTEVSSYKKNNSTKLSNEDPPISVVNNDYQSKNNFDKKMNEYVDLLKNYKKIIEPSTDEPNVEKEELQKRLEVYYKIKKIKTTRYNEGCVTYPLPDIPTNENLNKITLAYLKKELKTFEDESKPRVKTEETEQIRKEILESNLCSNLPDRFVFETETNVYNMKEKGSCISFVKYMGCENDESLKEVTDFFTKLKEELDKIEKVDVDSELTARIEIYNNITYHVIEVDPKKYTLGLGAEDGNSLPNDAELMLTAPLIEYEERKTSGTQTVCGGYVFDKKIKKWIDPEMLWENSNLKKYYKNGTSMNFAKSNGVFGYDGSHLFIHRYFEEESRGKLISEGTSYKKSNSMKRLIKNTNNIEWAFQSGPVLMDPDTREGGGGNKKFMAVIAYINDNKLLFVFTKTKIDWTELVDLLKNQENVAGALYLDGIQNVGYKFKDKKDVTIAEFNSSEKRHRFIIRKK